MRKTGYRAKPRGPGGGGAGHSRRQTGAGAGGQGPDPTSTSCAGCRRRSRMGAEANQSYCGCCRCSSGQDGKVRDGAREGGLSCSTGTSTSTRRRVDYQRPAGRPPHGGTTGRVLEPGLLAALRAVAEQYARSAPMCQLALPSNRPCRGASRHQRRAAPRLPPGAGRAPAGLVLGRWCAADQPRCQWTALPDRCFEWARRGRGAHRSCPTELTAEQVDRRARRVLRPGAQCCSPPTPGRRGAHRRWHNRSAGARMQAVVSFGQRCSAPVGDAGRGDLGRQGPAARSDDRRTYDVLLLRASMTNRIPAAGRPSAPWGTWLVEERAGPLRADRRQVRPPLIRTSSGRGGPGRRRPAPYGCPRSRREPCGR